jgi:hypothetical protein
MQERRHISVRALLPLVPPDLIPPTRAVPGAPLSVTRDTRKGRDARAAPLKRVSNLSRKGSRECTGGAGTDALYPGKVSSIVSVRFSERPSSSDVAGPFAFCATSRFLVGALKSLFRF